MNTLTKGQAAAEKNIAAFLASNDSFYLLHGSAGSGKTFCLADIPAMVTRGEVVGATPTHKSCAILSERLPDIECQTIHKFLGLRPKRSKNITTLIRRNDFDPSSNFAVRLVIVDECSMIGSDILKYIQEDADMWNRKYILSGDTYQLNPVNEVNTPCFDLPFGKWQSELTEIVRQSADNPIIRAATVIREAIRTKTQPDILQGQNGGLGVQILRKAAWEAKLTEYVNHPDPDNYRVIAYKNDTVRAYNRLVRGLQGKDTTTEFSVGEYLVVNEAYSRDEQVLLNTGMEFKVGAMEPITHPVYSQLKGWSVTLLLNGVDIGENIPVLDHLNCGEAYKTQLNKLVTSAQQNNDWRPYYKLSESFCDLRPLFSITSHKSQGSTFENVFVDYRDIYSNRNQAEADRCLYVALTRAKYNAFILI